MHKKCECQLSVPEYYTKLLTDDKQQIIKQVNISTWNLAHSDILIRQTSKYEQHVGIYYQKYTKGHQWTQNLHWLPYHKRMLKSNIHIGIHTQCPETKCATTSHVNQRHYRIQSENWIDQVLKNVIIVILDVTVVSMYKNTSYGETMWSVSNRRHYNTMQKPLTEYMLPMLAIILKHNAFEFNTKHSTLLNEYLVAAWVSRINRNKLIVEITFHETKMNISETTKIKKYKKSHQKRNSPYEKHYLNTSAILRTNRKT